MARALSVGGRAFRIYQGQRLLLSFSSMLSGIGVGGRGTVEYDSGKRDSFKFPDQAAAIGNGSAIGDHRAKEDGWITQLFVYPIGATAPFSALWGSVFIIDGDDASSPAIGEMIAAGYISGPGLILGVQQPIDFLTTWVFQGTIAEDATAGTHVCTLTVTPGAGNEMELIAARLVVGNTATAQSAQAFVTDGTNIIYDLLNSDNQTSGVAALVFAIPDPSVSFATIATSAGSPAAAWGAFKISGTMSFVMRVTTAAVSVTQTFACAFRFRGTDPPEGTLLDTIGTSINTINTDSVF